MSRGRYVRLSTLIFLGCGFVSLAATVGLGQVQVDRMTGEIRSRSARQWIVTAESLAHLMEVQVRSEVRSMIELAEVLDTASVPLDPYLIHPILKSHHARFPDTDMIVVGDAAGQGVAFSLLPPETRAVAPTSYADRDYYQELMRTGEPAISRVQLGRKTGRPNIHVAAPLRDEDIRGYVATSMDLDALRRLVDRAMTRIAGGRAWIWDRHRRIIVDSSDPEPTAIKTVEVSPLFWLPEGKEAVLRSGVGPDGMELEGAAAEIRVRSARWSVLVTQPTEVLLAETGAARTETWWIVAVTLVLAAIVSLLLAGWVSRPIRTLSVAARRIGDGKTVDLDRIAKLTLSVEAQDLVGSFRFMVERLQTHAEQLDAQVRERTAELEEARNQAEQASRTKSAFIASMSHEIRTPMNGVIGMVEMLVNRAKTPELARYARTAQRAARALLELLNEVLDFSKLDADRVELDEAPFRLSEQLELIDGTFRGAAEGKGVALEIPLNFEGPDLLLGDAPRLRQILGNLVGNAVKFTEQGAVRVEVRSRREGETAQVQLAVVDTGIGIPEDQVDCIFDDFAQVDGAHTRRFGGTGLGLAICRRLVDLMGGRIEVTSVFGTGTRFEIELSWPCAEEAPLEPSETPQSSGLSVGRRILVVDDNAINREVAEALLEVLGMEVCCVESGPEAIERVKNEPFDLILMDCQMPDMTGFEATAHIRNAGFETLPILALTANVSEEDRRASLASGMNDHLAKPITLEELEATLGRWL